MDDILNSINGVIWSRALIGLCLGVGLWFSIRTRFMQVRGFAEMLRLMVGGQKSSAGVSSWQALSISLSGRIGVGNIAGIATAIAFGGPGAIFWMWVMAFLGASTSYIECTLGQIYKEKDDKGLYRGGPAFYIEKGLGNQAFAWVFAIATIVACGVLLPTVQANGIASSMHNAFGLPPMITAIGMAAVLAFIIFGGVRRIAVFAEWVMPFMAGGYVLAAIAIMVLNSEKVPEMFSLIFRSAFGAEAAYGAVIGLAVEWGVKRGIYSNEAGQGTGPHSAAAAEVSHPAKQGYVQAFSIYFDAFLVCTATAFIILNTDMYNVIRPAGGMIVERLPGVEPGVGFVQAGIETTFPGFGSAFVALAILFFAFTTLVAYYYMAETNIAFINRKIHRPWMMQALRVGMVVAVVYGSVRTAANAWTLGDIGVGLMSWLNIAAILLLQKPAIQALKDYEAQKKAGRDPVFDPDALQIRNAALWTERLRENGSK
ncbi:MAG TPA: alanine/glycine:cation symporter family protein [Nevskiaceae bacterium]|nr:alanine/glycine:cation symporter family protein [Nevskiaceae bacterium]